MDRTIDKIPEASPFDSLGNVEGKSPQDILLFLQQDSNIDLADVAHAMTKKEEERILKEHRYKITQGKDGRWRTYVPDEKKKTKKRLIAKATEEKLHRALIEHYRRMDPRQMTLADIYPDWLEFKSLHTKAETYILRIERDWNKYYKKTKITKVPLVSLTKLQLDEWAHKLIKKYDMTKKQYYNATVIMRQAFDYAVDLGIVKSNTFAKVKVDGRRVFRHVKKKENQTQVFTNEEVRKIEELVWKDTENPFCSRRYLLAPLGVLFMLKTGVRVGEMLAACHEDISEDGKWIHIQRQYRYETDEIADYTKGAENDRYVPLPEGARKAIDAAVAKKKELGLGASGFIFSVDGKPMPYAAVRYQYVKYCEKLDTVSKSSHKARKTYVSALMDEGVNLNTIREFVGHTDEKTTLNCYCFDRSDNDERLARVEKALSV